MTPFDWTDGSDTRLAHARGESPDDPRDDASEQPCCALAALLPAAGHAADCMRHDPETCPTCRMEDHP